MDHQSKMDFRKIGGSPKIDWISKNWLDLQKLDGSPKVRWIPEKKVDLQKLDGSPKKVWISILMQKLDLQKCGSPMDLRNLVYRAPLDLHLFTISSPDIVLIIMQRIFVLLYVTACCYAASFRSDGNPNRPYRVNIITFYCLNLFTSSSGGDSARSPEPLGRLGRQDILSRQLLGPGIPAQGKYCE